MKDRTYPRRGLHGELVHDIGVRILGGELKPGDSVVAERDDQDVSRTVVREAVKVLAAKGLIASRPKTGTQVRERRYWHMLDPDVLAWRLEAEPGDDFYMTVFETRRLIEPAVAALAATRASEGRGRRARGGVRAHGGIRRPRTWSGTSRRTSASTR